MDQKEPIDLFLFTYNCGKSPVGSDNFVSKLTKSLPPQLSSLYVFGVEELCDIIDGTSFKVSNRHFLRLNQAILDALNTKYGEEGTVFHTLSMVHIGAIGLIVLSPYPSLFSDIHATKTACGYFYSSLKGAVGIRLNYKKSVELTFANAHLSAYEGEFYYQRRNQQVISLMRALDFNDGFGFLKPNSHSFFMGDLNYRTVKSIKEKSVITELASLQDQSLSLSNPIEELVQKYDELSEAIRKDEVFMGFTEGCINFPPTYKFHVGTGIYNVKRSPSWCDRILYQSTYNMKTNGQEEPYPRINQYNSLKTLLTSDHLPVFLSITIPFDAPEPIIADNGYLKILPNDQVIDHFHRDKSVFADNASGPTQIYMKPTKVDRIVNYIVTPTVDSIMGNTLWFTTTSNGRLVLLLFFLIVGSGLIFWY
ncbi:phosphatidylinositol 4,5-bisphosphate 5-phosphatase Inp54p [[Candida] jaroonii]|uniref:Phosphatidylinositol 4,5-bisphosphate 5-phosphatase Inp54p n=1 Tax=[Candida] jaroonii TaxID=467808 RepID=A0ACA9Y2G6_9ASCO|nr:phosphatidylinositol 4,5-bisphosphate 5-phosphatase Inp54p [[Candida] jaroonii]